MLFWFVPFLLYYFNLISNWLDEPKKARLVAMATIDNANLLARVSTPLFPLLLLIGYNISLFCSVAFWYVKLIEIVDATDRYSVYLFRTVKWSKFAKDLYEAEKTQWKKTKLQFRYVCLLKACLETLQTAESQYRLGFNCFAAAAAESVY